MARPPGRIGWRPEFDRERCLWQLTQNGNATLEGAPDPLLEAVAKLLSPEAPEWSGSASELMDGLDRIEIQPSVLMRRLNVGADRLWNEYGIRIDGSRSHAGRIVKLILEKSEA